MLLKTVEAARASYSTRKFTPKTIKLMNMRNIKISSKNQTIDSRKRYLITTSDIHPCSYKLQAN